MGGLGVKIQHFPLTLLVVLTTLTPPCERDDECIHKLPIKTNSVHATDVAIILH